METKTREERQVFETRRLHNLLLLHEASPDEAQRSRMAQSTLSSLRAYLVEFYGLFGR